MSKTREEVSIEISKPYPFSKGGLTDLEQNRWVKKQWPVVYFIENETATVTDKKIAYIGESTQAVKRMKSHLANRRKAAVLTRVSIIGSDRFNKSATLDIEFNLIQYVGAEGTYQLLNGNYGQVTHHYYEQNLYRGLFRQIWDKLRKQNIVRKSLADIENSQVFKYSPFKSLTEDQHSSVLEILNGLTKQPSNRIFVEGGAGTGKTILATYLVKLLRSEVEMENNGEIDTEALEEVGYIRRFRAQYPDARIGLVVAMKSLRRTLKNVFRKIPGLEASMVIKPSETFKGEKYDLMIVDEAHRLRQYRNISWAGKFRENNRKLGLGDSGTELDWILANSKNQVFFYDREQTVRPSDIDEARFTALLNDENVLRLKLHSQMRVKGGSDYIRFVDDLLRLSRSSAAKGFDEAQPPDTADPEPVEGLILCRICAKRLPKRKK